MKFLWSVNFRIENRKCLARLGLLSLNCVFAAAAFADADLDGIYNAEVVTIELSNLDDVLPDRAAEPLVVRLKTPTLELELELIPSNIVGPDTKTFVVDEKGSHAVPTVNYCYSGKLRGDRNSFVRVALMKGSLRGIIWTSTETYILEPLATYDPAARVPDVVVYKASEDTRGRRQEVFDPDAAEEFLVEEHTSVAYQRPAPAIKLTNAQPNGVPPISSELRRVKVGLMADAAFVNRNHAGVAADAAADMQLAIDVTDAFFRGTAPTANGSVPVAVVIGSIVTYTSETQQELDGIHSCPIMICQRAGVNNPGTKCVDENDCTFGSSVANCIEAPETIATCSTGTYKGKVCFNNAECPGSTCSGPMVLLPLCDGNPLDPTTADGRLCQPNNASTNCQLFGNCCPTNVPCVSNASRAAQAAGRYRTAPGHSISVANSGSIHLFTGCDLYQRGVSNNSVCGQSGTGSWSLSEHPKACAVNGQPCILSSDCSPTAGACTPASALTDASLVAHELGHMAGAQHDDNFGACGSLRITEDACLAGSAEGKMCVKTCTSNTDCVRSTCTLGTCQDCPGSSCSVHNRRECSVSGTDCFVSANCPLGETCAGPQNRLCVGGVTPGSVCNAIHANECPGNASTPAGTCTGAPMNWHFYLESGSYSKIGGFSPCSRAAILNRTNPPSPGQPPTCYTNVDCGDLNRSGAITAVDAQAALRMSTGLSDYPYDDLADVLPTAALGGPDGSVLSNDALLILQLSVGSGTRPVYCGTEDVW